MSTDNQNSESADAEPSFDINNSADFYRWATPMLLHILKYRTAMPSPPASMTIQRAVFRQVIKKMIDQGLWGVYEGLAAEDKKTVNKWLHDPARDTDPEYLPLYWGRILTAWSKELEDGIDAGK